MSGPRYALYYVPPRGSSFYAWGASLLGYDLFTGETCPFPADIHASAPDWQDLSREPRVYGFHATLKAPFHLAPGASERHLHDACETFAAQPRPIPIIRPVLSDAAGFVALVPAQDSAALNRLAEECVRHFDELRAPLTPADRTRRNPSALSTRQAASLDRWGYPYVFEDFRFHMTLTGRLPAERRAGVLALLQGVFSALTLPGLRIDRIALLRQDTRTSSFRLVSCWPLQAQ